MGTQLRGAPRDGVTALGAAGRLVTSTTARPRLLILGHLLPWPLDTGVAVRAFNIWQRLADHFQLRLICFTRRSRQPDAAAVAVGLERLREFAEAEAYELPWDGPYRRAVPHLRSLLQGGAYTRYEYASRAFSLQVRAWGSSESTDLIHLESIDLAAFLPNLSVPVACTHHNVESLLLMRRAVHSRNPALRGYLGVQARRVREEERKWLPRVALNVAVSHADAETLDEIAPRSRIVVAPNGVDTNLLQPVAVSHTGDLGFLGGLDWFPNRDALDYYVEAIEPEIRSLLGSVKLRWVGAADRSLQALAKYASVQFTGFVRDPAMALGRVGCFIVPLRVGGGTRLKILEAWGLGLPVVSTSVGCEGLDARDGDNILIADTPVAFARAVERVLREAGLRNQLSKSGREMVVRSYDWGRIVGDLAIEYRGLLQRR